MSWAARSSGAAESSNRSAPHNLDNDALMERLVQVQSRARDLMREFNIGSANVSVMAWQAEQAIADTAVRAEFLRLLIDLHEFGRRARQRGLLAAPRERLRTEEVRGAGGRSLNAAVLDDRGTSLFASDEEAADGVSADASRAFFQHLDR
jgi:hypothetical protein